MLAEMIVIDDPPLRQELFSQSPVEVVAEVLAAQGVVAQEIMPTENLIDFVPQASLMAMIIVGNSQVLFDAGPTQ